MLYNTSFDRLIVNRQWMRTAKKLKNPVFIFGFPRSGTTLIRSVLNQHSRISLVNEPELVWALRHAGYDIDSKFSRNDRLELLEKLKQIGFGRKHLDRLSESIIADFLEFKGTLSFSEVFEKLLPRPQDDRIVWGDKSLNNLFFVHDLQKMYPNSLLIHIVRDVRSVLLSYFQKKRRKPSDAAAKIKNDFHVSRLSTVLFFARHATLWERWMSFARRSEQVISSSAWIEIRFEDFLKKPQECLRSVCDKIGVVYEDRILDTASRGSDIVLTTEAAYAHERLAQDLDKSRVHSYDVLPKQLVWIIERQAGIMMQQLGYRLICPTLPSWQRLALNASLAGYKRKLKREVDYQLRLRGVSY